MTNSRILTWALLCLIFSQFSVSAQVNPWLKVGSKSASDTHKSSRQTFSLNQDLFERTCSKAPGRTDNNISQRIMSFPDNNGGFEDYAIYKSQILHPELAKKFPEIESFVGKSAKGDLIHFSYSKNHGLHAYLEQPDQKSVSISPSRQGSKNQYLLSKDSEIPDPFECLLEDVANKTRRGTPNTSRNADDGYLRKYRLALSTTGEYARYFLDGTEANDTARKAKVLAAMVSAMTHVNMVFERDFGVTMEIVANNDEIIYLNASTDPYSGSYNGQLQQTLDTTIGSDAYDVGHVFVLASNIHGNAGCIACVCSDGQKGSAFSAHYAPETENFNRLVMHEMGHQFGSYHTMGGACRSGFNSEVEPGSGSTIMSYAGICHPNIQSESDDYFNYVNVRDVGIWTIENSDCAELVSITNNAPTADAGNDYTIPKSTPFTLAGVATDADGLEGLTYCWEQNDPENPSSGGTPSPSWTQGAIFRSRPPVNSPVRHLPRMSDLLQNNLTPTWEVLPGVARSMEFAFTVRDNGETGGQTASDLMQVTVDGNSGPFELTSPNTNVTWESGETVTVNWNVAQTDQAPINVSLVSLFLSIDGYEYDIPILEETANDGEETFVLPALPSSTTARLMLRAVDNIFFALNPSNFTTQASEFIMALDETSSDICSGEDAAYSFMYTTFLDFDETVSFSVENLHEGLTARFAPETVSGQQTTGRSVSLTITGSAGVSSGAYEFDVVGTSASIVKRSPIALHVFGEDVATPVVTTPEDGDIGLSPNLTFQWEANENVKNYQIDIATDTDFTELIESHLTEEPLYTASSLTYDAQYYYRVKSINKCSESGYTPAASFTTACAEPSNFRIMSTGATYVELQWDSDSAGRWEVEYGAASFEVGSGTVQSVTGDSVTVEGLTSSTPYEFYLRAVCNLGGTGEVSDPVLGTTLEDFCSGDHFYDSGGPDGNYADGENYSKVIAPDSPNDRVKVQFNAFRLESCCDRLQVYDGDTASAPLIGTYSGNANIPLLKSTHASGALTFVFRSDGSVTRSGWDATVICEPKPNCETPIDVVMQNRTSNSVTLSWMDSGDATEWLIEYGLPGFVVGTGTQVSAGGTTGMVSGLEPNTTYEFYVRSVCSDGGNSDESAPITLETLCTTFNAPFFEPFSTYSQAPDCWESDETQYTWQFNSHTRNLGRHGQTTGATESGSIFAYIDDSNFYGTAILETPSIDISSLTTPALSFFLNSHNEGGDNQSFSVDVHDGSSWVEEVFVSNENTIGWERILVDLSFLPTTTEVIRIRFIAEESDEGSTFDDVAIDDIKIDDFGACYPPNISESQISTTKNSIVINWTPVGTVVDEWEIEYGEIGFTPGAGLTTNVNGTNTTLVDLASYTQYDFYMKAFCDTNNELRKGPFTVRTAPVYCEGDHFYDSGGPTNGYLNNEAYTETIIPQNAEDRIRVNFLSFSVERNDYLRVYDGPDENSPLLGEFTGYGIHDQLFSTHETGSLTFSFTSNTYNTYQGWEAEIICEPKPNCTAPSSLEALTVLHNSVELLWQENGDAENWEIEYGVPGFTLGTGTIVAADESTFQLSNMRAETGYEIYVRASCAPDEGFSDVAPSIRITTGCSPLQAPFREPFGYYMPQCWQEGEENLENWIFSSYGNHVGQNGRILGETESGRYFAYVDDSYQHSLSTALETPLIDVSAVNHPGLSFYLLSDNEGGDNVNFSVDVFDGSFWNETVYESSANTLAWQKFYVDFSDLNITGPIKVRFVVDELGEGETDDIAIDDVYVGEIPRCLPPVFNLAETEKSFASVNLSWRETGNATSWRLEYGQKGFTPGNGITTATDQPQIDIVGLDSNTEYDFYVYSICNVGSISPIEQPYTIKTYANYCNGDRFYDSGGADRMYTNNENYTETISPQIYGTPVKVEFLQFELESCCDYLTVFDGPDINAPLIGRFNGSRLPPILTSTHPSGTLTFRFTSDGSAVGLGWEAEITCMPLPIDNFQVTSRNESCRNSNNGSIYISTSASGIGYTALLERQANGQEEQFVSSTSFDGATSFSALEAGRYRLCIGVENSLDFSQCYTVNIAEPDDLGVFTSKMASNGKLKVQLSGGEKYWVNLNGEEIITHNSQLELDLRPGKNNLSIRSAKDCQGMYKESFYLTHNVKVYPNPTTDGNLKVLLPSEMPNASELQLYTTNGKMVLSKQIEQSGVEMPLPLEHLPDAIYILKVIASDGELYETVKIIKE
ncbi:putative secreted protein (Por secretion system target) [Flavobacteriaceae bacterium MAR_2009_75]|nr:putative secreted protein (Por secretion system target) [Flavobacteriaceae bacterium MAR_2009_75]